MLALGTDTIVELNNLEKKCSDLVDFLKEKGRERKEKFRILEDLINIQNEELELETIVEFEEQFLSSGYPDHNHQISTITFDKCGKELFSLKKWKLTIHSLANLKKE